MFWSRAVALCLLVTAVADLCSGLMLERLPRHIPRSKIRISHESAEDDDVADSYDTSVEKKRIVQDPSQLAPFIMKPTWKAIYPFSQNKRVTRSHKKRETGDETEMSERDQKELANILKDDDEAEMNEKKKKNEKKEASRHTKTKRQSSDEPMPQDLKDADAEDQEPAPPTQDFQGKTYGLTSESCDGSFIEQTQTICRNDAPCESTASLLVVPLRQRRVFYKRSNPDVCVEEPCVEAFLKEGLAAMEEGRYALRDNFNAIRQA
ncbi:hypothetical protein HNY73_020379 [Argiope bruennichi]|uniref:Secreted protein n=1 Tax=Argiope bruennichi TaxID=94029 RepID=A0A8T0E6J3_ARGBR|nr:hypothetical protein HNY73_020379 [Argiope bruennichi]